MDRGGDEFPAPLLDDTDEVVPNERGASNVSIKRILSSFNDQDFSIITYIQFLIIYDQRGQSISGIRVDAEVADALKMDDCCG